MIFSFGAMRPEPGIRSGALLGESWRMMRARRGPFLSALLLANAGYAALATWTTPWAAVALKAPAAHWGLEAFKAAVGAVLTAFTLRLLLAPHSRWWRLDRSLAHGVALLTLASFVATAAGALGGALHHTPFNALNELLFQIPVWGFCATLMLWPVGVLIEADEMNPARSITLMRGNVVRYVAANLLLLGLLMLAMAVVVIPALALHIKPATFAKDLWLPLGLVFGVFSITQTALWAALYRARTAPPAPGPLSLPDAAAA